MTWETYDMAGKVKRLSRSDGVSVNAPTSLSTDSTQVDFTLNNNATSTTISGISMSSSSNRSGKFLIDVKRDDDADSFHEVFEVTVYWDGSAWVLGSTSSGDDSGVSFAMKTGGALQYTSSNMTGGNYSGSGSIANIIKINT